MNADLRMSRGVGPTHVPVQRAAWYPPEADVAEAESGIVGLDVDHLHVENDCVSDHTVTVGATGTDPTATYEFDLTPQDAVRLASLLIAAAARADRTPPEMPGLA